jgi:AcrR family transcriptional regulator
MNGDRRVRRTRTSINDAFVQLVSEKEYDDITIADILDRADVGRSTFYAHFEDKDDLMRQSLEGMRAMLAAQTEVLPKSKDLLFPYTAALYEHVFPRRRLVRASGGPARLRQLFTEMVAKLVRDELRRARPRRGGAATVESVVQFVVGTWLTILATSEGTSDHPAKMEAAFRELAIPGVRAALDLH